jgi:hypothetical protein
VISLHDSLVVFLVSFRQGDLTSDVQEHKPSPESPGFDERQGHQDRNGRFRIEER